MKVSGLISELYHKELYLCSLSVQSFLSPCFSCFLHHKFWYCNPRLAKAFFLKNQSTKIHSYTDYTGVCIAWVLWNTPSQANFKAGLCHHSFFWLLIIVQTLWPNIQPTHLYGFRNFSASWQRSYSFFYTIHLLRLLPSFKLTVVPSWYSTLPNHRTQCRSNWRNLTSSK